MAQNNMINYTLYFKLAFTCQTKYYTFPENTSIANFIEMSKNLAYNDFNIDRNVNIEVVEAGQGNEFMRPEDAPALISNDSTLRDHYDNIWKNKAFYIRIVNNI